MRETTGKIGPGGGNHASRGARGGWEWAPRVCGSVLVALGVALSAGPGASKALGAEPLRLAVLSEGDAAREATDVLTGQLSGRDGLEMLERNDLERIQREQALSAAGRDVLKLGRVLGADGLLLVEAMREGTNRVLASRLVAVRPGVVLAADRVASPPSTPVEWAAWTARWLEPLLPKLRVTRAEAVPISVVGLRSAAPSREAERLERQLTLLTLERLTRERGLFVLERGRLEALQAETDLESLEDAAFWSGRWLLEGVLDRDGYSEATITVHARLLPAQGGAATLLELQHPRSDPAGLVDALARKVQAALQPDAESAVWIPLAEARRFLEAAQWALQWGMFREAQRASEAAWVLGQRDLETALLRVRAEVTGLEAVAPMEDYDYRRGATTLDDAADFAAAADRLRREHPGGIRLERQGNTLAWATLLAPPSADRLRQARRVADLYGELIRVLPPEEPALNSPWHAWGVRALTAVSRVLQQYQVATAQPGPEMEALAELRDGARRVAVRLRQPPTVRDSYWVGDRRVTHDVLSRSLAEGWNIYKCQVEWGCFWQERPEDAVAMYRELLSSPVFCYVHRHFWGRSLLRPRLAAWTPEDERRKSRVWQTWVEELARSTNFLHRMEAKALEMVDAADGAALEQAFEGLCGTYFEHREVLLAHPVELVYLAWDIQEAVDHMGGGAAAQPVRDRIWKRWSTEYSPRAERLESEYWERGAAPLVPTRTAPRAAEVRPEATPPRPAPLPATHRAPSSPEIAGRTRPGSGSQWTAVPLPIRPERKPARAPIEVTRFVSIPADIAASDRPRPVTVAAQRWAQGRLWLDVRLGGVFGSDGALVDSGRLAIWTPANDSWQISRYPDGVIPRDFLPVEDSVYLACGWWEQRTIEPVPESPPRRVALTNRVGFDGPLESSDDAELRRFDCRDGRWTTLGRHGQPIDRLFGFPGRILGANSSAIWEISPDGRETRILASARRRPPVSALDTGDRLGEVQLAVAASGGLRAAVHRTAWAWNGQDWEVLAAFPLLPVAEAFDTGIAFRSGANSSERPVVWWLPANTSRPELIWDEPWTDAGTRVQPPRRRLDAAGATSPRPRWRAPRDLTLANARFLPVPPGFWFYRDQCTLTNRSGTWKTLEADGRHADLICLDPAVPEPLVIPVRFDTRRAAAPTAGQPGIASAAERQPRLTLTPDHLLIGHAELPGVWVVPRALLEGALDDERRACLERERLRRAPALARYDHNRDRFLDPTERATAIDDPAFLEAELDTIAPALLGWLEAPDLAFFDVNQNGRLDSHELAGIQVTQQLLAARSLRICDRNGNATIDRGEVVAVENPPGQSSLGSPSFATADADRDGELNPVEFGHYLALQTLSDLRPHPGPAPFRRPTRPGAEAVGGPDLLAELKTQAEAYWARSGHPARPAGTQTRAGQETQRP